MYEFLQNNQNLLWLLAIVSIFAFIATLVVIPWLVTKIPVDYFSPRKRPVMPRRKEHPVVRWILLLIKNLLGAVLFLLGLVMLVTPGQGLLTMLVGLILLDFPGKFRFERWIISNKQVLRTVNWLRQKRNREALKLD
ncbi:MAG: hypothetical protein P8Y80_01590 [Acidobacteriota bacterium]|jgi:Na+/H+ antiporter NhaD/arsenite permease-like protein